MGMSNDPPVTRRNMLDRVADCLTPDSARRLLKLQIDDIDRARIDQLADKAARGDLSQLEQGEYRDLVETIDLIGILQAKARKIVQLRAS